jgi:ABC-2 type transport system ATP-binding protein
MNTNEYAVEVDKLTKKFGAFIAVDTMSFKVRKGEIFGFLGANGAGKSTTIKMLCGLLTPTAGRASVGGFDIATQSDDVKNKIGYMSQKFSLYEDLTVEENINFYGGVYGLENDHLRQRKAWAIEMAGLVGKEKSMTRSLAGGWKQRLALGCAVLHQPPILFLDEPTGGVDPISRRNFWDLIYSLSHEGVTVFVTTHYMDEAEHCNTIGLVHAGKLAAFGSPLELKHQLDRYQIFEVGCSNPVEAMDLLQHQPWVVETSIFGTAFHVSLVESYTKEHLEPFLVSKNISANSIERIVPSLEDVFIHLIGEEERKLTNEKRTTTLLGRN